MFVCDAVGVCNWEMVVHDLLIVLDVKDALFIVRVAPVSLSVLIKEEVEAQELVLPV